MKSHIEAEIFVVPECDGGRQSPFFSGYRPQFRFRDCDNDCVITLLDGERLCGGEIGMVALMFPRPDLQIGRFRVGAEFCIAEGTRVVGRGTITAIREPKMIEE